MVNYPHQNHQTFPMVNPGLISSPKQYNNAIDAHQYKDLQQRLYRITPHQQHEQQYQTNSDNYEIKLNMHNRFIDDLNKWQSQNDVFAKEAWEYYREYRTQLRKLRDTSQNNWYISDLQI